MDEQWLEEYIKNKLQNDETIYEEEVKNAWKEREEEEEIEEKIQ